jgi:hypothetical protein
MADQSTHVTEEGMPPKQEGPRYERIGRQGFAWLDAELARRADATNRNKQRTEYRARCQLANVLAEERTR